MALGKNRYRVLIVGAGEKVYELFRELLPPEGYEPPLRAASAGEARRMLQDTQVDLVILNAPLRDEFGTQLALKLAVDSGVDRGLGPAVADGFDFLNGIRHLHEPQRPGEQVGLEIRPQTEAHNGHIVIVHDGPQLVDLLHR